MIYVVSGLIFAAVVCFGIGLTLKVRSSSLREMFSFVRRHEVEDDRVVFLDSIWEIKPVQRQKARQVASIGAGIGLVLGLIVSPLAGLLAGMAGIVLAPRVFFSVESGKKKAAFFKQFPRAVSELAAVARTSTLLEGFRQVKNEHPAPVSEVFGYIASSIESGTNTYLAVKSAQEQYGLPGLDRLADAVRIITELGGGEKAAEVLSSAAEHVRFQERFAAKVNTAVSGIMTEMAISTGLILLFFLITSGPQTENWEAVQRHPVLILIGLGALGAGWVMSYKKLKQIKDKAALM